MGVMEIWRNGKSTTPSLDYSASPSLYAGSVILADGVPVHHVPPGFDVIGPAVLIVQIVRVLPNVHAQNRLVPLHERIVLVGRRDDFELTALVFDQPSPTAAETADARGGEFFLERI